MSIVQINILLLFGVIFSHLSLEGEESKDGNRGRLGNDDVRRRRRRKGNRRRSRRRRRRRSPVEIFTSEFSCPEANYTGRKRRRRKKD